MYTTLNKIRVHSPCGMNPREVPLKGFCKLRAHLGDGFDPDEPVSILTILKSNGLDDALWCLRAVEGEEARIRRLACTYALQVAHLWDMPTIVRKYLETQDESLRVAAGAAADAAAGAAAWAAAGAADAAVGAAARVAQESELRRVCAE